MLFQGRFALSGRAIKLTGIQDKGLVFVCPGASTAHCALKLETLTLNAPNLELL